MESNPRARTPAGPARKPKKKRPPSPLPPSTSPVPGPSSLQEFRPVPRPYLARAPSPISNTPHNRLAEMVLPSSFTRPQEGPSAQILSGAAVGSGGPGRERGQKKKKASRYAQGLLAPPSIVPGGVPAAPRVQHQHSRDRRRGDDRLGRHAGGTTSQTRLQDLAAGNPSQTSLGHLATILGSDPVAVEQDPAPARRRRRIVRGEEEEGLRRRVTVSSREEGRALGVARGASMRRRNVWDEISDQMAQESGEPPPPFPFPNAATARLPPAFARSPLSQGDAGSQAGGGEGGRARSPPPTWEQAVGLAPSPAPALAPGTGITPEDQPAPPTLVVPPTASRRSHRGSSTERSASPASTRYESAPSSPSLAPSPDARTPNLLIPSLRVNPSRGPSPVPTGRSQSGISPIIEQDEAGSDGGDGMTEQEREDRRMWNADLLAGYTLEDRVKREWERKVGREGGVGEREGQGGEEVEAEQPQSPVAEGPAKEEPPVASDEQETVAPVEEDAGEVISPAVEPPNPSPPPLSHTPPPSTPTDLRPRTPPPAPVQPDSAPAPIPSPKKPKKSKKKGKERANTAQERKRMTSTEMGEKSPVAASSPRTPWSTEAPVYKKEVREGEEVEEAPSRVYGPPKGTLVPREEEVTAVRPKDEGKPSEKAGRNEPETLRPLFQKTAWASSPEVNQISTPAHVRSKSSGNVLGGAKASVTQAEAAARKPEDELTVGRRKSEGNLAGSGKKDENAQKGVLPPSREAALRRRDLAVPKPAPAIVAPVPASPPKPPIAKVEKLRYGVSGPLINLDDSDPAPSSSASSIKAPQKYMRDDERGDKDKADVQKKRESNQSLWRLAASSADLLQLLESGGDQDEPSTSSKPGPEDTSEAVSSTAPVASLSKIPPPIPPSLASRRKIPPPIPPRPHYIVNQPPPLPPRRSDIPPPVPPLPAPKRRPPPPPPPRHPVAVAQLGLWDEESRAERDVEAGSEGIPLKDTAAPPEEPRVSAAPASVSSSKRPLGPRPPPPPRPLRLRNPWAREQAAPSPVLSEPAPAPEPERPDKREETTEPLEGPRLPPKVRRINAAPAPAPVLRLTPLPTPTPLSGPTAGNMIAPRLTLRPSAGRTQSDVPSQSAPHPTPSQAHLGLHQGHSEAEAEEADDTRVNRSASAVDLRDGDGVEQAGVGVDVTHGENGSEDGLRRLPSVQDGPGPGVHSRPGPSVIREEREGSAGREYTDLELFVARLDGSGREYEGFSHLTTFLGPSKPAAASPAALATLLPGIVSVDSRRTTPQGKVKLKLSLLGVRVAKCPICLSQFKGGDKGVLVPGCGHAGHESCVKRWFREDGRCFVCREVLKEE
ncbi:hypothetical protein L202_01069 [Cryptococcus amylolentus CBS 6039]|uniref:RING-type domain-containing protein n=2 Tax=Cryptococcus amylolentus TaxID=104669 RepID=A0A1E3I4N9_9TREE|nr:hypothetical protein L202_01069 [Cryptococcus amylolentus CBS 6039]ODN82796.1 hypothetical protein L202_01069 [Cryptococcus amylolentus CBS 6039]ODO10464.1 hypothetical protein I350_01059 [Cryptococcus amylolentus CBS 6273]